MSQPDQQPAQEADGDGLALLGPGARVGSYRIDRRLGAGGMGAVYEATHTGLDKRVAVKTLHPSIARSDRAVRRFMREGKATSRIRHPHVVDVTDVGVHDDTPYLVMERLEGEDLGSLLGWHGALPLELTLDLMLPVMSAIAAAHDAGIVHRDLKPENIFLEGSGRSRRHPKVLDFGLSKMLDRQASVQLTGTNAMLGTPHYMAPEQARSAARADERSDQYALGVILYECLTGETPFDGSTLQAIVTAILDGRFVNPRRHDPDIPEEIESIILRAMAHEPGARFESVRHLGHALLPHAGQRAQVLWEGEFDDPVTPSASTPLRIEGSDHVSPDASTLVEEEPPQTVGPADALQATVEAGSGDSEASTLERTAPAAQPVRTPAPQGASKRALRIGAAGVLLAIVGASAVLVLQDGRDDDPATVPEAPPVAAPTSEPAPESVPSAESEPPAETPEAGDSVERYAVTVRVTPPEAEILLDGERVGTGHFETRLPADGTSHTLRLRADGYEDRTVVFRDAPPPERIELEPEADRGAAANERAAAGSRERPTVPRPRPRPRPQRPEPPDEPDEGTEDDLELGKNEAPIID